MFLLLCMLISFIIWQCKKRLKTASDPSKSDVESRRFYCGIHVFSYRELMEATKNFDSSKELGDGGFGTVYYGEKSQAKLNSCTIFFTQFKQQLMIHICVS